MDCYRKFKFDKIDKMFLAIIFVFAAIFCFFNVFSFADTLLSLENVSDLYVGSTEEGNYTIVKSPGAKSYLFLSYPNHTYEFTNTSDEVIFAVGGLFKYPTAGDSFQYIRTLYPGRTYTFTNEDDFSYFWLYSSVPHILPSVSVYDVSEGFKGSIGSLVQNVSILNFWDTFEFAIPYILVVVVFSLGVYFIYKLIRGLSKGKGRI